MCSGSTSGLSWWNTKGRGGGSVEGQVGKVAMGGCCPELIHVDNFYVLCAL